MIAPSIELYLPFIHMVLQDKIPYAVYDFKQENPFVRGIILLLSLWKERFETSKVMQVFQLSFFREKQGISKEHLNLIETWVEEVKIGWGFDYSHRQSYFDEPLLEKSERGTWQGGLDHLLEELVTASSDRFSIGFEEGELLGKLAGLMQDLYQELSLVVREKKELVWWAHKLTTLGEKFFVISNEGSAFFQEFENLSAIEGEFGFESCMGILSYLAQSQGSFREHQLQAVHFGSFASIGSLPTQATCLLGMEEGAFPRLEETSSLATLVLPESISKMDEDRAHFLEVLLACRRHLWISYVNCDEKDGKKREPSPLVQLLKLTEVCHVPSQATERESSPFFKDLYHPSPWYIGKREEEILIDIKHLSLLAKHPIQFYFNRKLQIYFEKNDESDPEFTLSHLNRYLMRQSGKLDPRRLPQGAFTQLAEKRMGEEGEAITSYLSELGLSSGEIISLDLKPGAHQVTLGEGRRGVLFGKLEHVTPLGLLSFGTHQLKDLVKIWPLYLVYLQVVKGGGTELLCAKNGKRISPPTDPHQALLSYLRYYELALDHLSPLMPDWVASFKKGDAADLNKALLSSFRAPFFPDPYLDWIAARDPLPSAPLLMERWGETAKEVYGFI